MHLHLRLKNNLDGLFPVGFIIPLFDYFSDILCCIMRIIVLVQVLDGGKV